MKIIEKLSEYIDEEINDAMCQQKNTDPNIIINQLKNQMNNNG